MKTNKAVKNSQIKLYFNLISGFLFSLSLWFIAGKNISPRVKVGDVITLGHYEQNGSKSDGPESIGWEVLKVQDDMALVISVYALDAKPYNKYDKDVTWETCTLRAWMNDDFYYSAFTSAERNRILLVNNRNPRNQQFGTYGGNNTRDHIFALSIDEADSYFSSMYSRVCWPSEYAKKNGVAIWDRGISPWWLRSPSYYQGGAACIADNGRIDYNANVGNAALAVRPAMWIKIK